MRKQIREAAVLFVLPAAFGSLILPWIRNQLWLWTVCGWALWPPGFTHAQRPAPPTAISEFLARFDVIAAQGFVQTRRAGDTGVGHTLEVLLGLTENNDPGGDFRGIEVKSWRIGAHGTNLRRPMNLFLKEPNWLDRSSATDRIKQYGYLDNKGRPAWYQSVTSRENSEGLCLQRDDSRNLLLLLDEADAIGCWPYAVLAKRLAEKHRQAVFVGAETDGRGSSERFRYTTVDYCQHPSVERFLGIVEQGDVIVELRMHVKSNGRARNHGTAFRIRKDRIPDLYSTRETLRPLIERDED